MIKGLNISKKYKKFELQPTSIEIDKGEIVALIGENGAGKSTLIKCMCGVIDADEGQLEVDDQVVKKIRRCFGSWIYESGSKCLQ